MYIGLFQKKYTHTRQMTRIFDPLSDWISQAAMAPLLHELLSSKTPLLPGLMSSTCSLFSDKACCFSQSECTLYGISTIMLDTRQNQALSIEDFPHCQLSLNRNFKPAVLLPNIILVLPTVPKFASSETLLFMK